MGLTASTVNHLMRLLNAAITSDHVLVRGSVATAIVCLFSNLGLTLSVLVNAGLLGTSNSSAIFDV